MADPFPPNGRLIHVANEFQWNGLVEILDNLGVKLFEIPSGPDIPDFSDVPAFGLMFKPTDN